MDSPVYVEPFLGAGAAYLALLGGVRGRRSLPVLTPLCSWMGGKRDEAADVLALLDLRPGHPIPAILGDASWWGWVWPVVLDPVTGPEVSRVLRSWRSEDPRALWFRLRDLGPMEEPAEAAAQLLWLQARAASGVPVWWETPDYLAVAPGDGRKRQRACERSGSALVLDEGRPGGGTRSANAKGFHGGPGRPRLLQEASTQIDDAGQRQAKDPRLVATTRGSQTPGAPYDASPKGPPPLASDGRGVSRESGQRGDGAIRQPSLLCDHEPPGLARGGGIVDPGTIADRADRIRARLVKASGGEAGIGYDDGFRRGKGWRLFEPGDIASRADRIRAAIVGDVAIYHTDARTLTEEWAPRLGPDGRWYFDGPYDGCTGYPVTCPRDEYLAIVEIPARHRAPVVVSEAVGLAADLGPGWAQVQFRGGPKPEWVTCHGCDIRAILPALLRRMPSEYSAIG